ncbi:MAG: ribosome maturation factor RimP, partial [Solirubrobacterales bacterium]
RDDGLVEPERHGRLVRTDDRADEVSSPVDLLGDLRESYSLEVSSPGPERPLTQPEHFARFEGRRAKLTTREKIDGRRNFIGTIIGSDETTVTLGFDETVIAIPLGEIEKARLAPEVENAKRSG